MRVLQFAGFTPDAWAATAPTFPVRSAGRRLAEAIPHVQSALSLFLLRVPPQPTRPSLQGRHATAALWPLSQRVAPWLLILLCTGACDFTSADAATPTNMTSE